MNQFFVSGGQSTGASASASVLPVNIQGLISFRIDWLDLAASVLQCSAFFMVRLSRMLIIYLKPGRSQSTLTVSGW